MSDRSVKQLWRVLRYRCFRDDIELDPTWAESFEAFIADIGPRPSTSHWVMRYDPQGAFGPGTCRWATPTEQARARTDRLRFEYQGAERTLAEIAELTGISYETLAARVRRGTPVELLFVKRVPKIRSKAA